MVNFCDVAVIGAGIAGLTCAKNLHNQGLKVLVFDKSRGVGGRLATRRLHNTCVEHGLPYLEIQGELSEKLITKLCQENIIQLWDGKVYELNSSDCLTITADVNRYFAPQGITAVAKFLAENLKVRRESKVIKISYTDNIFSLQLENNHEKIKAKYIVCAIPAPQALMLIENSPNLNLSSQLKQDLESVSFYPSIVVMAGYSTEYKLPEWQAVKFLNNESLKFLILDSSKRINNSQPVFVFHSSNEFAQQYLDTNNLDLPAQKLLKISSNLFMSWLVNPDWYQVHKWRYATVKNSFNKKFLRENNLLFCGDWCSGNSLEDALKSGINAAESLFVQL